MSARSILAVPGLLGILILVTPDISAAEEIDAAIAGDARNTTPAVKKPLKVYILAGQSNMQGSAHKRTFAAMGDDPKTTPLLRDILQANGEPNLRPRSRL